MENEWRLTIQMGVYSFLGWLMVLTVRVRQGDKKDDLGHVLRRYGRIGGFVLGIGGGLITAVHAIKLLFGAFN